MELRSLSLAFNQQQIGSPHTNNISPSTSAPAPRASRKFPSLFETLEVRIPIH